MAFDFKKSLEGITKRLKKSEKLDNKSRGSKLKNPVIIISAVVAVLIVFVL